MDVQSNDTNLNPTHLNQAAEPSDDADGRPETSDDLETLRSELAEIAQKADEYLRLAQRTQADFINFRRRVEEERAQQARDANIAFVRRLLPVIDEFERALANAGPGDLESTWGQ